MGRIKMFLQLLQLLHEAVQGLGGDGSYPSDREPKQSEQL